METARDQELPRNFLDDEFEELRVINGIITEEKKSFISGICNFAKSRALSIRSF